MLKSLEELEKSLGRLPGLGRRSAARAALALVREPQRLLYPLMEALKGASEDVCCCSRCGSFTSKLENPCRLCTDETREAGRLCVVEEPSDILAIEGSGAFRGRYHVLGGKLSPARHMGPEKLRLTELLARIQDEQVTEVLLAVSTDMEGDATAGYLEEILKPTGVKLTRLAFGLPVDSGIAYSDPLTLRRAIQNRVPIAFSGGF